MLRVHFLNVGHGDCTVISHPSGHITVLDINNSQGYDLEGRQELLNDELKTISPSLGPVLRAAIAEQRVREIEKTELTDPIQFLKREYPNQRPFRFVLTHPDMDHMRGLRKLHDEIGFTNFWDTAHSKECPEFWNEEDKEDWELYEQIRAGKIQGLNPKRYTRGDAHFAFAKEEDGSLGGDRIEILSPTHDLIAQCNSCEKYNDVSTTLRVSHAGISILLPGDAERVAWDAMVAHYGARLKSTYLKASHHGRDSGYHLNAVQLIAPRVVCVSVGRKPSTDASSKYRAQTDFVRSTRYHGDIELRVHDNGSVEWFVARNADS